MGQVIAEYMGQIVLAIIAGIFSIGTIIVQKRQDKVINKIDEQTMFIRREKDLRRKLTKAQKEKEMVVHNIMILIMDTNLALLDAMRKDKKPEVSDEVFKNADTLKAQFDAIRAEIDSLNKEYDIVIEMSLSMQKELEESKKKKS